MLRCNDATECIALPMPAVKASIKGFGPEPLWRFRAVVFRHFVAEPNNVRFFPRHRGGNKSNGGFCASVF